MRQPSQNRRRAAARRACSLLADRADRLGGTPESSHKYALELTRRRRGSAATRALCCVAGLSDSGWCSRSLTFFYSWPGGQPVGSRRRWCAEAALRPAGQGPQPEAASPAWARAHLRRLSAQQAAASGGLGGPVVAVARLLAAGRPSARTEGPDRSLGQRPHRTSGDRLPRRPREDRHGIGLPGRYRRGTPKTRRCLRPAALPPACRPDALAEALRHPLPNIAATRLIVTAGRTVMPPTRCGAALRSSSQKVRARYGQRSLARGDPRVLSVTPRDRAGDRQRRPGRLSARGDCASRRRGSSGRIRALLFCRHRIIAPGSRPPSGGTGTACSQLAARHAGAGPA